MNFKTTLVLAIVLVALTVTYLVLPKGSPTGVATGRNENANGAAQKLIAGFGDARKIVVARAAQPDWIFEASGTEKSTTDWKMTAPTDAPVQKYMLDDLVRRLKDATVEEKFSPGSAGAVTPEAAGLVTPKLTITLTDDKGKLAKVALGKNPSDQQTYVRVDDGKDIVLASPSLKDVAREKAADYRDQTLLSLKQNTIRKLEIIDRRDGTPVTYRLVYNGKEWLFEEPFKALAVTKELANVTSGLANVRVAEWVDDAPRDFHGLASPAVSINVTVEEPAPATQPASTQPAESQPATVLKTYTLNVSGRSPLGDDTKVFVQRGDNPVVGTIVKTSLERFYPKVSTWRDMRLTTAPVRSATRVELSTPDGSATFEKKPLGWAVAGTEQLTGANDVQELLDALAGLNATAFIDGDVSALATFGLDHPQADIRLSMPELTDPERITIGGYTDPGNKLLVYARRDEAHAIAKVRASDVAKLIRAPLAYRDRTIVQVPPADVQRVAITRHESPAMPPFSFALTHESGMWTISEPAPTPTDSTAADALVTALCDLKGSRVVSESGDPKAYGLDSPTVEVEMSIRLAPAAPPLPAPATQPTTAAAGNESQGDGPTDDAGDEAAPASAPVQPAAPQASTPAPAISSIRLAFVKNGDAVYARREDRPEIYQIESALYDKLNAEYHAPGVFTFDPNQVKSVMLQSKDGGTQGFTKEAPTTWKYSAEPDLPIDEKKVKNYLVQLKDLKATRYAAYAAYSVADVGRFGMDAPQYDLTVMLDDGNQQTLHVSAKSPEGGAASGRYALMNESHDVFILPSDALTRFAIKPADFVSESTPPKAN